MKSYVYNSLNFSVLQIFFIYLHSPAESNILIQHKEAVVQKPGEFFNTRLGHPSNNFHLLYIHSIFNKHIMIYFS